MIKINSTPLTTLCLVTGYGISKLDLQCVKVTIFTQLLITFFFLWNISIILHHSFEKAIVFLPSKRRRFRMQGIEQYDCFNLIIIIIRE